MDIAAKILEILSKFPDGVPQPNLAKSLGLSKSYLSIVLRDLERQGLIYRARVGNTYVVKRAVYTNSTDKSSTRVLRLGIVWSSEYLFLGHFAELLRENGVELNVLVYPNAIQTILALVRGEVDGVLSPLVTQLYGYLLFRDIAIIGGGATGGGYVYEFPHGSKNTVISSELSTMDLCRYIAIKRSYIEPQSTDYFSSASNAIAMVRRGAARYAVVWHPLNLEMESLGGRKLLDCSSFEEIGVCCTLALSRRLGKELLDTVARIYKKSIEVFMRDRERYLDWYSSITGIDISVIKKSLKEYTYEPELSLKVFSRVVDALGLEIPTRSKLYESIWV